MKDEVEKLLDDVNQMSRSDGKGGEVPLGYDLNKDERTEFGFYWEYEDMEACAQKIIDTIEQNIRGVFS